MIVCPVCENQQAQGVECDVCGKAFDAAEVGAAGHQAPPVARMEGLETTAVDAPAPADTPELAPNAPCAWCGHIQVSGKICDRCGMQRHRGRRMAEAAGPGDEALGMVTCQDCGFKTLPGRCRNCGVRVQSPEA